MCKYIQNGIRLPALFSFENTHNILLHNTPRGLSSAFQWDTTPQGFQFWSREAVRQELSDEARIAITTWIEAVKGGLMPDV